MRKKQLRCKIWVISMELESMQNYKVYIGLNNDLFNLLFYFYYLSRRTYLFILYSANYYVILINNDISHLYISKVNTPPYSFTQ